PLAPNGAKPWEVKLCGWKLVAAMMKIAPRGTAIFHQVAALLVWASTFTPRKFTATKIAIRTTATMKPLVVRVPFAFRKPWAHYHYGLLGSVQPAGSNDGADRGPHQTDESYVPAEGTGTGCTCLWWRDLVNACHGRPFKTELAEKLPQTREH